MAQAGAAPGTGALSTVFEDEVYVASQWRLMWWRFRKHKVAMVATAVVIGFYVVTVSVEFLAPSDPFDGDRGYSYLRPQRIHLWDGGFRPHVYGVTQSRDPFTLELIYATHPEDKIPISFFIRASSYKLFGLFRTDRHLFGIEGYPDREHIYALGSDQNGRDYFSRLLLATRLSTSIGLIGVALSFGLGVVLGGVSGYYGGLADTFIQRVIEVFNSVPSLPLWIGLSAAVPRDWGVLKVYFAITVILSIFGWTGTARVVRGKFLSLREEDFVMAAQLAGANEGRIMFRHMLPSFYSHLIAAVSLSIPGMILGEIALSFLGLGLRPPAVSYGIMLQQAQNPQVVALYPWLMFVALPVIFIVLCFNFIGDGVRDAADPYGGR